MNYKEKIKQKGLKINWVAKQIGITRGLLGLYLNGGRETPLHIEDKLKEILN